MPGEVALRGAAMNREQEARGAAHRLIEGDGGRRPGKRREDEAK